MSKVCASCAGLVALLAMAPAAATAKTDCSYAATQDATNTTKLATGEQVVVYADTAGNNGGVTGGAPIAAGICGDELAPGAGFDGGWIEAGANPGAAQGYAIVDGSDSSTLASPFLHGYAGVSNYETGGTSPCPPGTSGSGSNSGGCLVIVNVVTVPVPLLICGNLSGASWESTALDGCRFP